MSQKITITYTVPSLTGTAVHKVEIEDENLLDTWEPVTIPSGGEDNTHDLNAYADGDDTGIDWGKTLGDVDVLKISVYPFIVDDQGEVQTDHQNPVPCTILNVEGDSRLVSIDKEGARYFGYPQDVFANGDEY